MRIYIYPLGLLFLLNVQNTKSAEVRLLDLDPKDAQQIINQQDTSLKYAPKIESNVPAVRFIGNDPQNVLEDIYLAKQYHGQDGLGGYLYGYDVPDISKTEKKEPGGHLKGAYNYIAGNGQEIKVEYWDDGTGFHQIDNVPKILPKQIEDTPEVKAAREEHFRIWHEEAERNSRAPVDPNQPGQQQPPPNVQYQADLTYPASTNQQEYRSNPHAQAQLSQNIQYSGQQDSHYQQGHQGQKPFSAAQPQQASSNYESQYSSAGPTQQNGYSQQGQYNTPVQQAQTQQPLSNFGQFSSPQRGERQSQNDQGPYALAQQSNNYDQNQQKQYQSSSYSASGSQYPDHQNQYNSLSGANQGQNEDDQKYPPKGFFYSFEYPVGIIVQKQGSVKNTPQQNYQ